MISLAVLISSASHAREVPVDNTKTLDLPDDAIACGDLGEFVKLADFGPDRVARSKYLREVTINGRCKVIRRTTSVYVIDHDARGFYRVRPAGETGPWWIMRGVFGPPS